jgi:DNA polymerase-3 subunit beta
MIKQTTFAVSDDPTRYHMNGVFFEKIENKLVMVATDGRRLAYMENETPESIDDFPGAIIPPKILEIVGKYAGDEGMASIAVQSKDIFIKIGSYYFYSVLFEGQFPNYRKVIPENQKYSVVLDKQSLMQAMKRVHLLVEKKSERIHFKVGHSSLLVYVSDSETGDMDEEIECVSDAEETVFALKYGNLDEPLKAMPQDKVKIRFTDISKAFTVGPEEEANFFHIMMPMQTDY